MGGGGSGPPSYRAEYDAYEHPPTDYRGQNEINQAAAGANNQAGGMIEGRIIPNMGAIQYYQLINRLHLEATERVNDQTDAYIQDYPKHILQKIITMEEAYQRIHDYMTFFATFDRDAFKSNLASHKAWFQKTTGDLCAFINRADYYKNRLSIQRSIENAIIQKRKDYVDSAKGVGAAGGGIPFECVVPDTMNGEDFSSSYITEVGSEGDPNRLRIYMSLPPAQVGLV